MSTLTKSSILLLPAILIAVYFYVSSGGEDFDAARSYPRGEICKQDEDRLAQLQAKPSFDEAVHFGSELKCLKLWPQLQALLDSLSPTAGSTGVSSPNDAASNTSAREDAPPASSSPATETTATTSDDACKHDEDRLAELTAKPSIDKAMRFGSELRCSKLRPQLLAILDGLGRAAESARVSNDAAPDTPAGEAEPPAASPAREATSTTLDDACKHDADRFAGLQAKPSIDDAIRFQSELRCSKWRPQLLALTRDLASSSPPSSGGPDGAKTDATNESSPASEATADAERRIATLERERDVLAAEVGRLEHNGDSTSPRLGNAPVSPQPAIPAERSDLEASPASATLPEGMPTRVLIRYLRDNAEARRRAESLANALTRQSVEVADLRESAGAIQTELSFSYAPDEAIALRVGRLASIVPVRRPQPRDGLMARPGTVELSISSDSRVAVITTSRKESNHE
jgi:hypothetical protein